MNRAIADSCNGITSVNMTCLAGNDTDTISVVTTSCINKGVYYEDATKAKYGGRTWNRTATEGMFCICVADANKRGSVNAIGYDANAAQWTLNGTTLSHPGVDTHSYFVLSNFDYTEESVRRWHCQVALATGTPTLAS